MKFGTQDVTAIYYGNTLICSGNGPTPPPTDSLYPPRYNMKEPLIDYNGYKWLPNINPYDSEGESYNAKLFNSDGTAYIPDATQYPLNGTLELPNNSYAATKWPLVADKEWVITGIYDIQYGTGYKIYAIHYKGNSLMDVYEGDESTSIAITQTDVAYTPSGTWDITEGLPDMIAPPSPTTYEIQIDFNDAGAPGPYPVTTNVFAGIDIYPVTTLKDTEGNDTLCTLEIPTAFEKQVANQQSADNPVFDIEQSKEGWRSYGTGPIDIPIYLETGTYQVTVGSYSLQAGITDFTLAGTTVTIDNPVNDSVFGAENNAVFTSIVSSGEIFNLNVAINGSSDRAFLTAIQIIKES